jgi:hypothetical protein
VTAFRRYRVLVLVAVVLLAAGLTPALAAVTLTYFRATPMPDAILLEWETATEINTAGFYILRKTTSDGPWDSSFRLKDESGNDASQPAQGVTDPLVPHQYEWRDTTAQEGIKYFYVLEELENTGRSDVYDKPGFIASAMITPVLSLTPTSSSIPSPTPSSTPTTPPTSIPNPTATATLFVAGSEPTVTSPPPRAPATSPPSQSSNPVPSSTPVPSATPPATATKVIPPTVTQGPRTSPTVSAPAASPILPPTPTVGQPTPVLLSPTPPAAGPIQPPGTPSHATLSAPTLTASAARSPTPSPTLFVPAIATTTPIKPDDVSGPPMLAVLGGALALGIAAFGLMRFMTPSR